MSFKEVNELRKKGNLAEALQKAKRDMDDNPQNIWNKRSIAWVYYDFLKKYAKIDSYDQFKNYLTKLSELDLPEEEKMIFDNSAFQVGKIVFEIQKEEHPDFSKLNEIFDLIKEFHFTKPSEAYSFLYKAFHKGYKNWSRYLEFADWWDFENFMSQDFLSEEFKDRKQMPVVEKAYIAYAKKLLQGERGENNMLMYDIERIWKFETKLDKLIQDHPEYQYPPYFRAKLLFVEGKEKDVLKTFIPFAKKKRNDFWVWELLADSFAKEDERKEACFCKALSLNTPDDFLIHTRVKLAEQLIEKKLYAEAKHEIKKSLEAREKHGWRTPNKLIEMTKQEWYEKADEIDSNEKYYNQHKKKAELILYQNDPEETAVVEFVNENKKFLNFVIDKNKYGFFNYDGLIEDPQIGDVIKLRIKGNDVGGYYKAFTVRKIDDYTDIPALNEFHGIINILEKPNIGFVEDVFFDSNFINKNNIQQSQNVNGIAVLSFNKKKKEWGWKAIKLISN